MPTDRQLAREKYREYAGAYDRGGAGSAFFAEVRKHLVRRLELKPGDTVLDVACGTGLSFSLILDAIDETGHLIGVDLSSDMLERARERIAANDWRNVVLLHGAAEGVSLGSQVDALLFCLTHDVMQSPRALENLFGQAKPGARVAAFGPRWAPWWAFPMNLFVYYGVRRYATTYEGLSQPWEHLARLVPDLHIENKWLRSFQMAWGVAQ